jgi:hypothetical protein
MLIFHKQSERGKAQSLHDEVMSVGFTLSQKWPPGFQARYFRGKKKLLSLQRPHLMIAWIDNMTVQRFWFRLETSRWPVCIFPYISWHFSHQSNHIYRNSSRRPPGLGFSTVIICNKSSELHRSRLRSVYFDVPLR